MSDSEGSASPVLDSNNKRKTTEQNDYEGSDQSDNERVDVANASSKRNKGNDSDNNDNNGDKQDISLVCKDCNSDFLFTVSEQEFYEEKGFTNQPVRCQDCRNLKKQSRVGDNGGRGGFGQRGGRGGFNQRGGRGGFGGGDRPRSNACFNCGEEGHRSFECSQPKQFNSNRGGSRGGFSRGGGRGGRDGGEGRSNVCFAFQKGNCRYGDSCRFSHSS